MRVPVCISPALQPRSKMNPLGIMDGGFFKFLYMLHGKGRWQGSRSGTARYTSGGHLAATQNLEHNRVQAILGDSASETFERPRTIRKLQSRSMSRISLQTYFALNTR